MVVRQRRKKNKLRGNRTHGGGNTKNRRGSGCRGGVGNAGGHKHKYASFLDHFGGKIKLKPKAMPGRILSLEELEKRIPELIAKKKAQEESGGIIIDGKKAKIAKVLGNGSLTKKVMLKNIKATEQAVEKIKALGGSIEGKKEVEQ